MKSKRVIRLIGAATAIIWLTAIVAPGSRLGVQTTLAQQTEGARPARPAADTQAKDRAAIDAFFNTFVKAFESRDAKALAALWTSAGEYENDRGVSVRGRAQLEQTFGELFSRTPEVTVKLTPTALRFLSADSAIADGTVVVRRGAADASVEANYSALIVRDAGQWRMAQLSESSGNEQSIEDIAWLIGEWQTVADGPAKIHTKYTWSPSKKFIQASIRIEEQDLALTAEQVIGVDPDTGAIHSWTFEADGGVGEAEWSRDGDHWVLDVVGSLVDGTTLVETNVLRRIDNDTLTWQSVDRTLGGSSIADLPPTKVVRVKPTAVAAR